MFNGIVGVVTMIGAVALTLYSLASMPAVRVSAWSLDGEVGH